MGVFGYYITSTIFLVFFLLISWIVTGLLHLSGTAEMIVRSIVTALAFGCFGLVFWHLNNKSRKKSATVDAQGVSAVTGEVEVDYLLRQAESRLAAAQLGGSAKLSGLPIIFVVGEAGAAKTSILVHSAVEPDLLAGQVYQDQTIVSTQPANFWLTRKTVIIEASGRLMASGERWMHLIKRLQPRRLTSVFRRTPQASRAAVVCFDVERFLRPDADEVLGAAARSLNARLGEISRTLGSSLPVYVLFTKLDQLGFFADFFGTLRDEEVHHVFGSTLPLRIADGLYAEEESRRLTTAFNELFYALCDKRPTFLLREHDETKVPRVYEFPREFRKLRNSLVRFLVDIGKPSQIGANPFLRGFYFSGVRPRVLNETAPLVGGGSAHVAALDREATLFFDPDRPPGSARAVKEPAQGARTRRVPQWLFLGHLFGDVVLQDSAASQVSGVSSRTELIRRSLLGAGTVLMLGWIAATTTSWTHNRSLEAQVTDAARGISGNETGGAAQQLPSLASLEKLETLRQSAALLSQYQREGAPLGYRWGLYVGDNIYPTVRRLYFSRFHQILFGATQVSLLEWLRKLPVKPGEKDSYKYTYDTLKGYLITTSHSEKSTRVFLSPLLMERWLAGREVDADRRALAQKQFDFYAEELNLGNPFAKENDTEAIERGRYYLAQFNAVESIYQFMLSEASRQKPSVNFNKQHPGSSAYVVNNKDVAGAFTAGGWAFMQDAIKNLRRFFGGESWVLGDKAYANLDPAQVAPELLRRYQQDFIGNWRAYLANSEVVRYASIADAAQKLGQLSSNQSFLMSLFCLATNNTSMIGEEARAPYQPVHYVQPAGCAERPVRDVNAGYLSALVALQTSLERVSKSSPPDEAAVQQTLNEATNAYRVTRQVAQNFRIDKEGNVHGMVQKLLEDPIRYAEAVVGRIGPAQLNSAGKRLCEPFADLSRKYPFNTSSKVDATLPEIESIFRPGDGRLAEFYETNLKNYVERRGTQIFARADAKARVTEGFLRFFNRAQAFSDALYRNGGKSPRLTYTMKALPAPGLRSITLALDGQTLKSTSGGGEVKEFTWPGADSQSARLGGSLGGSELSFITYDGLWSAFRLFGDADKFESSGAGYTLQWIPRQGQSGQSIRLDGGNTLTLTFLLDLKGAPPVFQKGYLSSVQCVAEVAR